MNGSTLYCVLKQQRLAWSSALIVGLTLTLIAHAPVMAVVAGCVIVMLSSLVRSITKPKSPGP
ncbi:MAG TPA: hypothetical protein VJQ54_18245 [Candidatus Sulfotelmatobacter sp.]|nr:hypothetical protein [Candidatus Sulfotelmatobacter sp.]